MKYIALFIFLTTSSSLFSQNWQDKIDMELYNSLRSGEEASALVVFKEKTDLSQVNSEWTKEEKGLYVFNALKNTAARSQAEVKSLLNIENIPYRSFYIINMISLKGDLETFKVLAERQEIRKIISDSEMKMLSFTENEEEIQPRMAEPEWGIQMIKADSVWNLGIRGRGVVVGGQDTGYEWEVSPLKEKYRGWNEGEVDHNYSWHDAITDINPLNDTINDPLLNPCGLLSLVPCDDNNHGTHTMGTMVGEDDENSIGVAPEAQWIGCRNMERGYGMPSTYIDCFQWFLAPTDLSGNNPDPSKSPHVINNSWGCPAIEGCDPSNFEIMRDAVIALRTAGVVVVVSAGNDGSDCNSIANPAAIYEESFSIGASNQNDSIAGFSSRGTVAADGSLRLKPNVVAPGTQVKSVVRGGGFSSFSGTSMAGPHVAGAVALIISANPDLAGKVDIIEDILEQTAAPKTTLQDCDGYSGMDVPNPTYGYGRIDAYAAVQAALDYTTSTEEINNNILVDLYPNPTEGIVTFKSSTPIERIDISSVNGLLIYSIDNLNAKVKTLDLNRLSTGMYFCKIRTQEGVSSGKMWIK